MRLVAALIRDWKKKREIEATAKREMLASFATFIEETRPFAPQADKYPQAALFRHVWKRAVALQDIAVKSNSAVDIEKYKQFQELAGINYFNVAPSGPYGKIRLALNTDARLELRENELARIADEKERSTSLTSRRFRGVVYLLKSGTNYKIGRTNDLNKRLNQIKLQLPDPVTVEHRILTNDPVGVEKHWHKRFASKRKGGEWFGLDDENLADFKKHSQM